MAHTERPVVKSTPRLGAVWFESELRSIERWAALRRALDVFAHRGEAFALVRLTRALGRVRQVLGPQAGTRALNLMNTIVDELARSHQFERALTINTPTIRDLMSVAGPFDVAVLRGRHRQSQLLWRTGRTAEALSLAREVADISHSSGADTPVRLAALGGLAIVLADVGQSTEAYQIQQEVLEGRLASVGDKDPATLRAMIDLFMTMIDRHEADTAGALLPRILATRIATFPARHVGVGLDAIVEANVADFREQQRLEEMLASGTVVSRLKWPREIFEM